MDGWGGVGKLVPCHLSCLHLGTWPDKPEDVPVLDMYPGHRIDKWVALSFFPSPIVCVCVGIRLLKQGSSERCKITPTCTDDNNRELTSPRKRSLSWEIDGGGHRRPNRKEIKRARRRMYCIWKKLIQPPIVGGASVRSRNRDSVLKGERCH